MGKVVIKILQGSVVAQTVLSGLTKHPPVANFLRCRPTCAKIYENWMAVDKVIGKKKAYVFGPPCRNCRIYCDICGNMCRHLVNTVEKRSMHGHHSGDRTSVKMIGKIFRVG